APELLPHVFDLFTQAERSLDRSQGGLGIGLALVKSLVELHGGTVAAQSKGANAGSEFTVRLAALPATNVSSTDAKDASLKSRSRNRILIVDDHVDAAESLRMLLEFSGHDVRCAYDGAGALNIATSFRP